MSFLSLIALTLVFVFILVKPLPLMATNNNVIYSYCDWWNIEVIFFNQIFLFFQNHCVIFFWNLKVTLRICCPCIFGFNLDFFGDSSFVYVYVCFCVHLFSLCTWFKPHLLPSTSCIFFYHWDDLGVVYSVMFDYCMKVAACWCRVGIS